MDAEVQIETPIAGPIAGLTAGRRLLLPLAALIWSAGAASQAAPERKPGLDGQPGARERWSAVAAPLAARGGLDTGESLDTGGVSAPRAGERAKRGKAGVSSTRATRRPGRTGDLDEKVIAHSDSANVRDLIKFLTPRGWRVRFDVAAAKLDRAIVFHAETTRRRALDQLCLSLGWRGIFYPYKRLVLIAEGGGR